MALIYSFPLHRLLGVDVPCDCEEHGGEACIVCTGGLALCVVCGGAESSLTTDCPGESMHPEVADDVSAGTVDYDRKLGWVQRQSTLNEFCRR